MAACVQASPQTTENDLLRFCRDSSKPLAGAEANFYRRCNSHERARQNEQTRPGAAILRQGVRVLRCEDWVLDTALIWRLVTMTQKIYADNRRQT